jgi:hypothetical protein
MIHNYVNVDCMGVYAPVDPHNFAVVNKFFRGGVYTGAVTQTSGNVETVTTPFVQSLYSMKPPASAVDLNSINYKPAFASVNTMFASPFVNIYGPHGELLSGTRDASLLGLEILGLGQAVYQPARSQANLIFPPAAALAQASRWPSVASFAPVPPAVGYLPPGLLGYPGLSGYRPAPLPAPFFPCFGPFGFLPVPGLI